MNYSEDNVVISLITYNKICHGINYSLKLMSVFKQLH